MSSRSRGKTFASRFAKASRDILSSGRHKAAGPPRNDDGQSTAETIVIARSPVPPKADGTTKQSFYLAPPGGGHFAAIIFDMGGTLLEFENVPWDALYPSSVHSLHNWLMRRKKTVPPYDAFLDRFVELLERRRARIRAEMREYQITPLVRELVAGFKITLKGGELSAAVDAYYASIRRQVTVFPEAKGTLARLKELGYTLGLLSNTPFRVKDHRQELEHFGLWPYFDAAIFTSTITHRKPHPEPFTMIAERLGAPLARSLYIGDRQLEDVQGPQGVGMTACLIRRQGKKYQEGLTESCEIWSLEELIPRLRSAADL